MSIGDVPPTAGGSPGGPDQERLMEEAAREREARETQEIHREEAAERGETPATKRPWWKFWG